MTRRVKDERPATPAPAGEQARTRAARAAAVAAARDLFLARGYAATALEAVSAAAGVPPATLYRLFGSKVGLLKAVLDVAAAGDDEPVPVGERGPFRAALHVDDPQAQVAAFAGLAAQLMRRVEPVHHMLVGAAAADPTVAELVADFDRQRQRGQARIAAALARRGALRSGLSERAAADVIFVLMSPQVFRLLTVDRGWSVRRYQGWLAGVLQRELLPARADLAE